jgi:hypothetical protein
MNISIGKLLVIAGFLVLLFTYLVPQQDLRILAVIDGLGFILVAVGVILFKKDSDSKKAEK